MVKCEWKNLKSIFENIILLNHVAYYNCTKWMRVKMSKLTCSLMNSEVHEGDFDCGNDTIESTICSAYYSTLLHQTYGYQICMDDKIVGYYMIYLKEINIDVMEKIEGDEYNSGVIDYYISAHINYIAIDKKYQQKKIGTHVLKGIISDILKKSKDIPIRLITLDALNVYHEWYKTIGFRDIPGMDAKNDITPMYMDCMGEYERKQLDLYYQI